MKNKENYLLYLVVAVMAVKLVTVHYDHKAQLAQVMPRDEEAIALKLSYALENRLQGQQLPPLQLVDQDNQSADQGALLTGDYQVVVVSSIIACSACRDNELHLWNDFLAEHPNLPVTLVVAEEQAPTRQEVARIRGEINGLELTMPYYLDSEGSLLRELGVEPRETPISLLIDGQGRIVDSNRGSYLTYDKSRRFTNLVGGLLAR